MGEGGGEVLAAASSGKLGNVLRRRLMGDDDNELQITTREMAPFAPPPPLPGRVAEVMAWDAEVMLWW